jgi:Rrf2 family protein
MSKILSMSEAVSIALHGMVLIARNKSLSSNVLEIAEATSSSRHHVAKVMQRLVKENYLSSQRGPTGGFTLKKQPEEISLLNIWEAVEGKIEISSCPLDKHICPFDKCIMNNVASKMSLDFKKYLESTTIASLV